jgi:hypothetical protein
MEYATKEDMTNLKSQLEKVEDSFNKRLDNMEGKLDAFILSISDKFVSKEICNLSHSSQKETFDKFQDTVSKVIWVAVTETVSLLVATIFFMLNYFK